MRALVRTPIMREKYKKANGAKSQKYQQHNLVYVIEEKVDRATIKGYLHHINNLRKKKSITKAKWIILKNRFSQGWVPFDSLSYSKSYTDILNELREIIKQNPRIRCRVVLAKCEHHPEYGIAIVNFNYKREIILPVWKDVILLKIKNILAFNIFSGKNKSLNFNEKVA